MYAIMPTMPKNNNIALILDLFIFVLILVVCLFCGLVGFVFGLQQVLFHLKQLLKLVLERHLRNYCR